MSKISADTISKAVSGLVALQHYDAAKNLIGYFEKVAGPGNLTNVFERLKINVELNSGNVEGALQALEKMVFERYSDTAARTLIYELRVRGMPKRAVTICDHIVNAYDDRLGKTPPEDQSRPKLLGGLIYFLQKKLECLVTSGGDTSEITAVRERLAKYNIKTRWDHLASVRMDGALDPSDIARDKWHVDSDVQYFPRNFPRAMPYREAIRELILGNTKPEKFAVKTEDLILTFGSCFAANLRFALRSKGFNSETIDIPEGLNNTFALRHYFDWVVSGSEMSATAFDKMEGGEIRQWAQGQDRDRHLAALKDAKLVVLTLGLAEVWEDRETKEVFWRGVPASIYDADRHYNRVSTVQENRENLEAIVANIRAAVPGVPIFITLSPIPLQATFSGQNCIVADAASKSVLRAAISEFFEGNKTEGIRYWPSFEMLRWLGAHLDYATIHAGDSRHPDISMIDEIIEAFCDLNLEISGLPDQEPPKIKAAEAFAETSTPRQKAQPLASEAQGKKVTGKPLPPAMAIDDPTLLSHIHREQKRISHPKVRETLARKSAEVVNRFAPGYNAIRTKSVTEAITELRKLGVTRAPGVLNPDQVAEIHAYLADKEAKPVREGNAEKFYSTKDLLGAPYLFDFINSDPLLSVAKDYLGALPTIVNVELYWSEARDTREGYQIMHRDLMDFKQMNMIFYLTDAGPDSGATTYIKESHRLESFAPIVRSVGLKVDPVQTFMIDHLHKLWPEGISEEEIAELFGGHFVSMNGSAGTGTLFDSYGLHCGGQPSRSPRLAMRVVFGLTPKLPTDIFKYAQPFDVVATKQPLDDARRYINRLFVC